MGTRCNGVAEIDGPGHGTINKCCIVGRDFTSVHKYRSLFLASECSEKVNGLLTAILCGAGQCCPSDGQKLILYGLQD